MFISANKLNLCKENLCENGANLTVHANRYICKGVLYLTVWHMRSGPNNLYTSGLNFRDYYF